jgi:hypothetical protein
MGEDLAGDGRVDPGPAAQRAVGVGNVAAVEDMREVVGDAVAVAE